LLAIVKLKIKKSNFFGIKMYTNKTTFAYLHIVEYKQNHKSVKTKYRQKVSEVDAKSG